MMFAGCSRGRVGMGAVREQTIFLAEERHAVKRAVLSYMGEAPQTGAPSLRGCSSTRAGGPPIGGGGGRGRAPARGSPPPPRFAWSPSDGGRSRWSEAARERSWKFLTRAAGEEEPPIGGGGGKGRAPARGIAPSTMLRMAPPPRRERRGRIGPDRFAAAADAVAEQARLCHRQPAGDIASMC